jgi:hypothetical protein
MVLPVIFGRTQNLHDEAKICRSAARAKDHCNIWQCCYARDHLMFNEVGEGEDSMAILPYAALIVGCAGLMLTPVLMKLIGPKAEQEGQTVSED